MDTTTATTTTAPAATTQPATGSPPAIFADGLNFAENWHTTLPEEFHGLAKDTKSLTDVFARMKGMRDDISARGTGIKVPGEKATDEEKNQFKADLLKHLGVPDTPDAYDIKPPEGIGFDEGVLKELAAVMPKAGLTPDGAKLIASTYYGALLKQAEHIKAEAAKERAADKAALATEYGDRIDGLVSAAKAVAKEAGWPEETMDPTHEGFIGAAPFKLIQHLIARAAKAEGVDRTAGGATTPPADDMTWAKATMEGKTAESEAWKSSAHPDHKKIAERITAAFKAAYPGKS
jgi:hypothetical protein